MTESGFRCSIANYNRSRGVQKTSTHLFRHTFAKKYLVDCGGNALMLQKLLAFFIFGIANAEPGIALPCLIGALILAIIIWVDFILAGYFYSVALIKGYKDIKYLKIAFYVPLVGYLLVIVLPDRGAVVAAKSQATPYAQQTNTYANDPREL